MLNSTSLNVSKCVNNCCAEPRVDVVHIKGGNMVVGPGAPIAHNLHVVARGVLEVIGRRLRETEDGEPESDEETLAGKHDAEIKGKAKRYVRQVGEEWSA